ncbi:MAG: metal-dependent hydrolase [bacterium]|nr:metal-dependent hydrolase [bacterium]
MSIRFTWLGHSTYLLDIDGHSVLIDPFLTSNPLAAADPAQLYPEIILLSHAHGDHVEDALSIAQRTGARIVCNVEMSGYYQRQGLENVVGQNTGGTTDHGFMTVKLTAAFHSSTFPDGSNGGQPNGLVITSTASGLKAYFAGDTALFGDMALIGNAGIDLALLPIGDHFTMGIDDSIAAVKLLRPRYVTPMHYNTFPAIQQNAGEWANRVSSETEAQPIVLDPGGAFTVTG